MYPSGSAPADIYGTFKMHKFSSSDAFTKLCPTVSFIGTFSYNLSVSFVIFFRLLVPNDYGCKDTFSYANLSKKFLVSNDVPSLFTNIPLQETVDIAMNFILDDNSNLNITKKELKKTFPFYYITESFYF